MKKRIVVLACSIALVLGAGACKKKEEQPPVPKAGMPGMQQPVPGQPGMPGQPAMPGQPGAQQPTVMMPKGETVVTIPDATKGKWKGVVLIVEDKASKKTTEISANLNSEVKVPSSDLKVEVGDFIPDFRMNGLNITSASDQPNNPAVGVKIFEGGKQIFPADPGKKWGWLYAKPELRKVHPFEHQKFGIYLKNGVKKG